jgi:hypothetical protein
MCLTYQLIHNKKAKVACGYGLVPSSILLLLLFVGMTAADFMQSIEHTKDHIYSGTVGVLRTSDHAW